jgi:hypothetical protein
MDFIGWNAVVRPPNPALAGIAAKIELVDRES